MEPGEGLNPRPALYESVGVRLVSCAGVVPGRFSYLTSGPLVLCCCPAWPLLATSSSPNGRQLEGLLQGLRGGQPLSQQQPSGLACPRGAKVSNTGYRPEDQREGRVTAPTPLGEPDALSRQDGVTVTDRE